MPIKISIPETELYDEEKNLFIYIKKQDISLEHSLVSLQKWEQKWKVPFLDPNRDKTNEQMIDYIRCMTITQNVDPYAYLAIPTSEYKKIMEYITDPMTATTIRKDGSKNKDILTAEIIYYWMIEHGIPSEYRKWHLNQLLTLIRVFDVENSNEKMTKQDSAAWRRQQNEARRKALHSKG